jgi:hypothetical protein
MRVRWPRLRTWRRGIAVAVLATLVVGLAAPSPAFADYVSLSGTTYSDADAWYISSNYRTITSAYGGDIYLGIGTPPLMSDAQTGDQIKWRLIGNWGEIWDNKTTYHTGNSQQWINNKPVGWQFRNSFARYTTCQINWCRHDFTGWELY